MNIRAFWTKKNLLIFTGFLMVAVITTIVIVIVNSKPSKSLISSIDAAWNVTQAGEQPAYLKEIDELSSYELNAVTKNGDRYIIEATVTAPDLGEQLSRFDYSELPQTENVDDINIFLCEQLNMAEIKETVAYIFAYKINGEYHISFSDKFVDAMSGNLYEYSQDAFVNFLQSYEEE